MGSPCLFTRKQAFNMRYFYWLRVKNSNDLHAELSLGYFGDAKFYLESKASFIDISSTAFTWRPSWLKSDLFRDLFREIWLSERVLVLGKVLF